MNVFIFFRWEFPWSLVKNCRQWKARKAKSTQDWCSLQKDKTPKSLSSCKLVNPSIYTQVLIFFFFYFVKTLAVCLCFWKAFCFLDVFVLCFFKKQPGSSLQNGNRVSLAAPIKRVSWNSLSTRLWLVLSWISNDFAHFCYVGVWVFSLFLSFGIVCIGILLIGLSFEFDWWVNSVVSVRVLFGSDFFFWCGSPLQLVDWLIQLNNYFFKGKKF